MASDTRKIIRSIKKNEKEIRTPIATEMFLPNVSNVHDFARKDKPASRFTKGSVLFANANGVATQDNTNFFWDADNNRLGIGNSIPTVELDVTGVIRASTSVNSDVFAQHGSASNANIAMSSDDTMTFDTGGLQAMHIDASQKVVVGDTTIADGLFNVFSGSAGDVTARPAGDDFVIENSGSAGMSILTPDTNTGNIIFGSPSDPLGADLRWNHDNDVFIIGTRKTDATLRFLTGGGVTALNINKNQNFDFQAGNLVTTGTLGSGLATIGDGSLLATSAAPTTDAMIANKKYVDDEFLTNTNKIVVLNGAVTTLNGNVLIL